MNNPILVIGAGRSAFALLQYLNQFAEEASFRFSLADGDNSVLQLKSQTLANSDPILFSALGVGELISLIKGHRIVISLLPPDLHPLVGKACLACNAHLITASYESPAMREMANEIEEKGLVFMNECGLDPGIDHMSAMEIIDDIHSKGGIISKFHSYCGGLVADEDDDNPFKYKISWNPRNVVLAGKGTSRYLCNGQTALLPYHRLFSTAEDIVIKGWGEFEAYPNRDSMHYAKVYGLNEIRNLKRGTLRKKGFCKRWNVFVQLGMTNDDNLLEFHEGANYCDFLSVFLPEFSLEGEKALMEVVNDEQIVRDILQMGFSKENPEILHRKNGTPADFLLDLIVIKWRLNDTDKDMVVMVHQFEYIVNDVEYQTVASFGLKGINSSNTSMSQTVGLPLGIFAKMLFYNEIHQKGLVLPLFKNIYRPILKELANFGVHFQVDTQPLNRSLKLKS